MTKIKCSYFSDNRNGCKFQKSGICTKEEITIGVSEGFTPYCWDLEEVDKGEPFKDEDGGIWV